MRCIWIKKNKFEAVSQFWKKYRVFIVTYGQAYGHYYGTVMGVITNLRRLRALYGYYYGRKHWALRTSYDHKDKKFWIIKAQKLGLHILGIFFSPFGAVIWYYYSFTCLIFYEDCWYVHKTSHFGQFYFYFK